MVNFYITSNSDLQKIVDLAYSNKTIAIDTEFTREKTYYPILSLIQIAIDKKIFVIDCFSDIDLSLIYNVVNDYGVKKIFHSSMQDLQIFYQQSKTLPKNIVDVQLMANFCGFGFNIGYSNLVEKLFTIKLDKKLQRSNWQQRPLDSDQIEYAALDVLYLEEIYRKLHEELLQKNRQEWFLEELEAFKNKVLLRDDEVLFKNFVMQKNLYKKNEIEELKMRKLILWREKMAQYFDVPRRHFLDDRALEEIVFNQNFDEKIDAKMRTEISQIFLECSNDNGFVQKNKMMNEAQRLKYHRARDFIAEVAAKENMKEQFLATTSDLKEIILGNKKIDELIYGWRYNLFGKDLQKIIN